LYIEKLAIGIVEGAAKGKLRAENRGLTASGELGREMGKRRKQVMWGNCKLSG